MGWPLRTQSRRRVWNSRIERAPRSAMSGSLGQTTRSIARSCNWLINSSTWTFSMTRMLTSGRSAIRAASAWATMNIPPPVGEPTSREPELPANKFSICCVALTSSESMIRAWP